jgi:hypothetical protein
MNNKSKIQNNQINLLGSGTLTNNIMGHEHLSSTKYPLTVTWPISPALVPYTRPTISDQ